MAYKKETYALLKWAGYAPQEAHKLASVGSKRLKTLLQDKILENLGTGAKIASKTKRQYASLFGFEGKVSDRLKGFSNANLKDVLQSKNVPEVKALFKTRGKQIVYKSAYAKGILLGKARYGERYSYKLEYEVFSDNDFFRQKKYVWVVSRKKLSTQEVYEKALSDLNRYDEQYGMVADPRTLKILEAYYMTGNEYQKLSAEKEKKENAKRAHNK